MLGRLLDDRYLLLDLLGQGGMGRVYVAKDVTTGERVAVKVIAAQVEDTSRLAARLEREARAMGRTASRHIVRLLHTGTDPATRMLYVVTEYLPGEDLHRWLKRLGPLPPPLALRLAAQACAALESVHAVGLVHRDLKPSNLFVQEAASGARVVKLLDFGLAKLQPGVSNLEDWGSLTNTGALLGTPFYMSPEQMRDGRDVDHRSDLWALGVVLYESLAGRMPHAGIQSLGEFILTLCQRRARPVEQLAPWVSPEAAAVVKKALELDPAHRFQSATEMRLALRALLAEDDALDASMFVPLAPALSALAPGAPARRAARQSEPHELTATMAPDVPLSPTVTRHPGHALASRLGRLPVPVHRIIGRERETAELKQRVSGSRLVTLLGPGGTGKTRLALHVAAELAGGFEQGACFVDLSPLVDAEAIPQAIAGALELREETGQPLRSTIAHALRSRHLLMVLDNCEHLIEACAEYVEHLLTECPRLWLLATSREALALSSETTLPLAPLPVPDLVSSETLERASRSDAVCLFVERAQAVNPAFQLSPANAGAVAHICRQLDGIPLALELAAARMRAMSVERLAEQIHDRFRLLTGVRRTASQRQRTLRALIDWSHELLTAVERVVLRRLSVFHGGFSLQAAEAVCAAEGPSLGMEHPEVLDVLHLLVSKSLVLLETHAGEGRYRMLETLRHYARDKLLEAGEEVQTKTRHFEFFLELAEQAEPALRREAQLTWLGRLDVEHDNLSTALDMCETTPGREESGLRLSGLLGRFWWLRGHYSEGRMRLERTLAKSPRGASLPRAQALCQLALLLPHAHQSQPLWSEAHALYQEAGHAPGVAFALIGLIGCEVQRGNSEGTLPLIQEGVALARRAEDPWLLAWHQGALGRHHLQHGESDEAMWVIEEGLALAHAVGDRWLVGVLLSSLSLVVSFQGQHTRSRELLLECLQLQEALGFNRGTAEALVSLGAVLQLLGEYSAADECFHKMLAMARSIGNEEFVARAYLNLAENALLAGKLTQARPLMKEFFERAPLMGHKEVLAWGLLILALFARKDGAPEQALRFFAAEQTLEAAFGLRLHPQWRRSYDETLEAVRAELGAAGQHVWEQGLGLRPEQALQAALAYVLG